MEVLSCSYHPAAALERAAKRGDGLHGAAIVAADRQDAAAVAEKASPRWQGHGALLWFDYRHACHVARQCQPALPASSRPSLLFRRLLQLRRRPAATGGSWRTPQLPNSPQHPTWASRRQASEARPGNHNTSLSATRVEPGVSSTVPPSATAGGGACRPVRRAPRRRGTCLPPCGSLIMARLTSP